jgi:hypothetical protein
MSANCSDSRSSSRVSPLPRKGSTAFIGYDAGWASAGKYLAEAKRKPPPPSPSVAVRSKYP